jgi:hypothetical protein
MPIFSEIEEGRAENGNQSRVLADMYYILFVCSIIFLQGYLHCRIRHTYLKEPTQLQNTITNN